jgi:hypothetical protein
VDVVGVRDEEVQGDADEERPQHREREQRDTERVRARREEDADDGAEERGGDDEAVLPRREPDRDESVREAVRARDREVNDERGDDE